MLRRFQGVHLMIHPSVILTLLLFGMGLTPPAASAEYVVEVPVLAAIRANPQGVFEMMIMRWDQKPQPDPIELVRYNSRVRLGAGNIESIDLAFAYAVERTAHLRHSGTVSIFGHAYRPTNSDGPSAGAVMAVGFIAMLKGDRLLRGVAMTGTLEPGGRIGPVGSIPDKMRAAAREGYRTILVPTGQIYGSNWNLNQVALELNLIIKEVDTIDQAYELMTGRQF
jgi:Lon-like protease